MADFTLSSAASEPLQKFVSSFVPYGLKNAEGTSLRKVGFSKADANGTGMASLAEIENFIKSSLQASLEDDTYAEELFDLFRPCFGSAFNQAKELNKNSGKVLKGAKTATADDYISFPEFRMFCVYLQIFAAMFDVFVTVDGGAGRTEDDDARICLDEFLKGYHSLGGLGFQALQKINSDEKATKLFKIIDANDGGFILYREWSKYIKGREIKAKTHIGKLLSGDLKSKKIASSRKSSAADSRASSVSTSRSKKASPKKGYSPKKTAAPLVGGVYKSGKSCTDALKDFIKTIQPYAEKNAAALKLRKTGYRKCDSNGTGECSLAEVDGFVLTTLKKAYGQQLGKKIFKQFRPSYIVAYNGAKNLKANARGNDEDYINFQEFRVLNVYLAVYAGMLDAFSTMDGGGKGVSEDDDRRLGKAEWLNGYQKLTDTGFVGLDGLTNEEDALKMFDEMDPDKSGKALFQDFCDVITEAEIEANTTLGVLLSGSSLKSRKVEDTPEAPQDVPIPEPEAEPEVVEEPEDVEPEPEAPLPDEPEPEAPLPDEPEPEPEAEEPVEETEPETLPDEPEPEPEAEAEEEAEPEALPEEPEPEPEVEEPAEETEPEPEEEAAQEAEPEALPEEPEPEPETEEPAEEAEPEALAEEPEPEPETEEPAEEAEPEATEEAAQGTEPEPEEVAEEPNDPEPEAGDVVDETVEKKDGTEQLAELEPASEEVKPQ